jgi:hypothetical protein
MVRLALVACWAAVLAWFLAGCCHDLGRMVDHGPLILGAGRRCWCWSAWRWCRGAVGLAGPAAGDHAGTGRAARRWRTAARACAPAATSGSTPCATIPPKLRTLAHGTTLHGEQSTDPALRCLPRSYYGPGSGAGIALWPMRAQLFGPRRAWRVVGLGTGTLACFAPARDQRWTFYEIDPAVLNLSRAGTSPTCPTARRAAPGGDRRCPDRTGTRAARFDRSAGDRCVLVRFDPAAPAHRRGIRGLSRCPGPRGVLLVHISNRFIELEPALMAEVAARGLHAAVREDAPPAGGPWVASTWVAVSRDPDQLKAMAALAPAMPWRPGPAAPARGLDG